jgi:23S rRNA (adenine2503-C2)-methyltransferase
MQAQELAELLQKYKVMSHVNLIQWNPVAESDYQRPSRTKVLEFQRVLEAAGVPVSVRTTRGLEAAAACGQLRNEFQRQGLEKPKKLV